MPDYIDVLALFISNINEVCLLSSLDLTSLETYCLSCDQLVQAVYLASWQKSVNKSVELICYLSVKSI